MGHGEFHTMWKKGGWAMVGWRARRIVRIQTPRKIIILLNSELFGVLVGPVAVARRACPARGAGGVLEKTSLFTPFFDLQLI